MRKLFVLALALCLVSLFCVPALADDGVVADNTTSSSSMTIMVPNTNAAESGCATAVGNASLVEVDASMDISAAGISDAGDVIDDPEIDIDWIESDGDAEAYAEYAEAYQENAEIEDTEITACACPHAINDLNEILTDIVANITVDAGGSGAAGIGVISLRDVTVALPI
ncbi:MAG: hypothetical protein AB1466_04560 [Actinomycetota bacterium]